MPAIDVRPPQRQAAARTLALAVADASWYSTDHLFRAIQRPGLSTLLLKCSDYRNAWKSSGPPWAWPSGLTWLAPRVWQSELVLSPGWMKRFPAWGMRPVSRAIDGWRRQVVPDTPLALVMTYPHYLYLRDRVQPDLQIYFNLDDYTLYWPERAQEVVALEHQAVRQADLTICVARQRRDALRAAVPEAADRIVHLPHGTPECLIAPQPWHRPAPLSGALGSLPRPVLGYVGTLEDRIDWSLLDCLAAAYPAASLLLVGSPPRHRPHAGWWADYQRCRARANVHCVGWRPQEQLAGLIAAFDVALIPYQAQHPFNQACCPTKIMDYMGSGRPIVSTDLPECRLYPEQIHVAANDQAFLDLISQSLAQDPDDGTAATRHALALANRCSVVAERFLDLLPAN